MGISVLDPIHPAIERTRQMLFRPFDVQKWVTLGFCSFLANLGLNSGGGGGNGGFGGQFRPAQKPDEAFESIKQWTIDHYELMVAVVLCIVVGFAIISTLIMWLSSRGQFLFLAGVARDRAAVREPWREFREQGNSLFWFNVWFGFALFLVVLAALVTSGLLAMPDIRAEQFGPMGALALALGLTAIVVVAVVYSVVGILLYQLVVPIMYLRRLTVMPAWGEFNRTIVAEHKGTLVLYLLFQLVLGIALGMIATLVACLTCCVAALPFISSVVLLPLAVFHRSYTLYFLEQFGPEWRFFTRPGEGPSGPIIPTINL
ncbi:MAG: hypothetical protein KF708_09855 [Pirellulales bacterium]|nr:hypothetical protein [Pirellulales bacterium]